MSSIITRTATLAVAAALVGFGAVPTAAAHSRTESTPVMVVLDASGSMTAADAPGPRIDAAKRAVNGLVAALPSAAPVGLEVYGTSTGSSDAEKAAGCKDIKVLVPVGPVDKPAFTAQVERLKASGYTPIGASLRKAAAALPKEGPRSIVLVSDGEDTCAPPQPCAVAKELKEQGVDLVVHTVGFKVSAAARAQLICIADATGGTYVDAPDGPSLVRQLPVRVARAMQPYRAVGTPITGAPSVTGAPQIEPGQYLDTFDRGAPGAADGTVKYYSVTLRKGDTPYISATVVPPPTPIEALASLDVDVTLTDVDETDGCELKESGHDIGYRGLVDATTAVLNAGAVGGPDWPEACPSEGNFAVRIARSGDGYETQPLKMEIALRVEPPADDSGLPQAGSAQPNIPVHAAGSVRDAAAGSSYNDAPLLAPGTYRDTVVYGETRYYRVRLQWGQRLAFEIVPGQVPGFGIGDGVAGTTRLVNPLRADLDQADGAHNTDAFVGGSSGITLTGSTTVPVRYTNRLASDDDVQRYAVDGDYYLVFEAGFPSSGGLITVPYTVTVSVVGTPEPGPVYREAASSATSAKSTGAAAPGSPAATRRHSAGSGTPSAPVLAAAGAGIAACAAGGAVLLLRRRRRPSGPAAPPTNWPPPGSW
jgi:Ca-activated chloride channel homolog